MKKIYFLLVMLCSVFGFTACSDDDDNPAPQMPVTGLSVPSSAAIGEEVNILGTGFSETARLYVKDAQGKKTDVTVSQRLTTGGLTVVFPATLTAGDYTLWLVQDGDWELGKIKLTPAPAPLPVTDLKVPAAAEIGGTLVLEGKNFPDDGEYYVQDDAGTRTRLSVADKQQEGSLTLDMPETLQAGTYSLILKSGDDEWNLSELEVSVPGPKRLKSFDITNQMDPTQSVVQTYAFHYNTDGKIDSIKMSVEGSPQSENWYIDYSPAQVAMSMTGKDYNGDAVTSSMNLTLQNGRVQQNEYVDEYEDTYTTPWHYEGEYLSDVSYGSEDNFTFSAESYAYKQGDMDTCTIYYDADLVDAFGGFRFSYEGQSRENNVGKADIVSMILYIFNNDKGAFYPRLLGLYGTVPAHMPTKVSGDYNKEFAYEGENPVEKVSMIEYFDSDPDVPVTTYVITLRYEAVPK